MVKSWNFRFEISKKYQFLDDVFLRVLKRHPEKMSNIFFNMFNTSPKTVIKFLSNKSNFIEDLNIILKKNNNKIKITRN